MGVRAFLVSFGGFAIVSVVPFGWVASVFSCSSKNVKRFPMILENYVATLAWTTQKLSPPPSPSVPLLQPPSRYDVHSTPFAS